MKLTTTGTDFAVFDGILSDKSLVAVRREVMVVEYRLHSTTVIHPVWRRQDGGQLIGPRFGLDGDLPIGDLSSELAEALASVAGHEETERLVGRHGVRWQSMSLTPWVYPQGTMLTMHHDGDAVGGAFSFYIHEAWPIRWGGWLIVMHAEEDDSFDLAMSEESALARGSADYSFGTVVVPIPNRLVVLSPQAKHLISRVDHTAGDSLRLSLNGVFHRSASA